MEAIQHPVSLEPHIADTRRIVLLPYCLALFFTIFSLAGFNTTDLVDADASRHAMNGVFLYDMVRTGNFWHPVEYAKSYYTHYPALTLPYHPPLFPAIEVLFYALFGVNVFAARLAVAIAVGACALLLYRLVYDTHANHTIAACVVVTMMMCATSRRVATDVMLEFPAMAFTLGALLVVNGLERPWTLRRGIAFGLLAGAAVWTKQHAVFLGAVPLAWAILAGRPRLLLQKYLWVGQAIFWMAVGGLIKLSAMARDTGVNQLRITNRTTSNMLGYTIPRYWKEISANLHGWAGIFAACAVAALVLGLLRRGRQQLHLGMYLVWAIIYCLLLMPLRAVDERYLFFAYPAVFTIAYVLLWAGCSALAGARWSPYLLAGFAAVWFVMGLRLPSNYLHGPSQVAAVVTKTSGSRILYSGDAIGNFVFAVRERDPKLQATVIQARRLPPALMAPQAFSEFCDRFGIDWVVLENQSPLNWMLENPPPTAKTEPEIPLRSTYGWNGSYHLFRWTSPHTRPDAVLEIPIPKIGGGVQLKF